MNLIIEELEHKILPATLGWKQTAALEYVDKYLRDRVPTKDYWIKPYGPQGTYLQVSVTIDGHNYFLCAVEEEEE